MKSVLLLLIVAMGTIVRAQNVSGVVTDGATGEALIGATVYVDELGKGTTTNASGYYSVAIPSKGSVSITFTFMGFESQTKVVDSHTTKLNVALMPTSTALSEVVVTSEDKSAKLASPEMGVQKLQAQTIKSVPVLLGETDVIKVMQLMPGVQAASEGSTGFSVRGGNPDQNLVLLDGSTIYNAGHFLGFFSVFNNDAISDVKLYKGDMPANFGGRLASLLEVNMKDGDKHNYHLNGGVGLISSRLTVEGPIAKERTSFVVSGRRTYYDLFLPFATDESARDSKIYFYDVNARISHTFNSRNHLFASGYLGRDFFKMPISEISFGNKAASLRWSHIFNSLHYFNLQLNLTHSDYKIENEFDAAQKATLSSDIRDIGLKAEFSSDLGLANKLTYGLQLTNHKFQPGSLRGEGDQTLFGDVDMEKNRALETAVFLMNTQNVGSALTLRYGLRLSTFHNYGPTTIYGYNDAYLVSDTTHHGHGFYNNNYGLEPRFSLSYLISENSSVKASYTRSYQYLQQASASTSGTPFDVWYMTSPNVRPQLSDQVSVGFFRNIFDNNIEMSLEAFYKKMSHTIDFKDHPDIFFNDLLEGELRFGSSRSYGAELMVKADFKRWNGWLSYTLSRADRTIDGINNGKRYLSPYNHTHDVSVVASYKFTNRLSLSANWVFISGAPTTFPVARYEVGGDIVPLYSSRNEDRMPDYHRLDMALTLQCRKNPNRRWQGEWVFSFYNLYNHHNTWAVNFERQDVDANDANANYVIKAKSIYLFPIIPSISYNFKF